MTLAETFWVHTLWHEIKVKGNVGITEFSFKLAFLSPHRPNPLRVVVVDYKWIKLSALCSFMDIFRNLSPGFIKLLLVKCLHLSHTVWKISELVKTGPRLHYWCHTVFSETNLSLCSSHFWQLDSNFGRLLCRKSNTDITLGWSGHTCIVHSLWRHAYKLHAKQ